MSANIDSRVMIYSEQEVKGNWFNGKIMNRKVILKGGVCYGTDTVEAKRI